MLGVKMVCANLEAANLKGANFEVNIPHPPSSVFQLDPPGSRWEPSKPGGGELEGCCSGGKHHGGDQPQGGNPQECQHAELRLANGCAGWCLTYFDFILVTILFPQAGADLENCNLSGSDLHEANLRGANLKVICSSNKTYP